MDDDDLQERFEAAAKYLRGISGTLAAEDLLFFYARYKQANEGPCNIPKPGFFDFQGKQKWQAWKDLGDMSREEAMMEYVDRLTEIDDEWYDKEPESSDRSWAAVSSMAFVEETIDDEHKTCFDWLKEENGKRVLDKISGDPKLLSATDDSGLGLIHWAADRGQTDMVVLLINAGCDVNMLDGDGQTPLHYAASCGHLVVVKVLLDNKADKSIQDADGVTPKEATDDPKIKELL